MNNVMKTPKNWAKDSLLTEQILDALNSTEGSDYIYTISVQGHGKYPTEQVIENPAITVTQYQTEDSGGRTNTMPIRSMRWICS